MKSHIFRQSAAPAWLLIALVAACAEIPTDLEGLSEVPPVLSPPTGAEFSGEIRLGVGVKDKRAGQRKSGGESESPTGGPSQTSDRKPLDRDPTEEGSAGKSRNR